MVRAEDEWAGTLFFRGQRPSISGLGRARFGDGREAIIEVRASGELTLPEGVTTTIEFTGVGPVPFGPPQTISPNAGALKLTGLPPTVTLGPMRAEGKARVTARLDMESPPLGWFARMPRDAPPNVRDAATVAHVVERLQEIRREIVEQELAVDSLDHSVTHEAALPGLDELINVLEPSHLDDWPNARERIGRGMSLMDLARRIFGAASPHLPGALVGALLGLAIEAVRVFLGI